MFEKITRRKQVLKKLVEVFVIKLVECHALSPTRSILSLLQTNSLQFQVAMIRSFVVECEFKNLVLRNIRPLYGDSPPMPHSSPRRRQPFIIYSHPGPVEMEGQAHTH